MMNHHLSLRCRGGLLMAVLAVTGWTAGCDREPPVTAYNAPKESPRPAPPDLRAVAPAAAATETLVSYQAPQSWQVDPTPRQMVDLAFTAGAAKVMVMAMPAATFTADPLGNINRWRAQVGLAPVSDLAGQAPTSVKIGDAEGSLYDIAGPSQRQCVAMLMRGESIWYFKLMGPPAAVEAERPGLLAFVESVKFGTAPPAPADPHAGMPMPGGMGMGGGGGPSIAGVPGATPPVAGLAAYAVAPTWRLDPTPRPMRELTYLLGSGDRTATVIVSRLAATSFSADPLGNINRWRAQVGLPEVRALAEQPVVALQVGGEQASLYDLTGPTTRQVVAMVVRGEEIWYFKVLGEGQVVASEKAAFDAFLSSVRFAAN
jgi:uncharacterized protein YkwD